MGILCGVCVWHATVPLFVVYGLDTARTIDMWGLIVSGSTYFMFHVCFFLYIYFVVSLPRVTSLRNRCNYKSKRICCLMQLSYFTSDCLWGSTLTLSPCKPLREIRRNIWPFKLKISILVSLLLAWVTFTVILDILCLIIFEIQGSFFRQTAGQTNGPARSEMRPIMTTV